MPQRDWGLLLPLLFVLPLLLPADLAAQPQDEIRSHGFSPEKAYASGDIDSIDLFNGSLRIVIPLGGSFPLNERFSYSLGLIYNSSLWHYVPFLLGKVEYRSALPEPFATAGLGWLVTFGILVPPGDEFDEDPRNDEPRWKHVGPDGAAHYFWDRLHPDDPVTTNVTFSRDNSYLRMTHVPATAERKIELPDGTTHIFEEIEPDWWEVTRIEDRHGNFVEIDRSDPLDWEIRDSQNRVQHLTFQTFPGSPFLPGPHVKDLQLAAFGGNVAAYGFTYEEKFVERGCRDTVPPFTPGYDINISVPLLKSVQLPADATGVRQTYEMTDATGAPAYFLDCATSGDSSGRVQHVRLPTKGRVAWEYDAWRTPKEAPGVPGFDITSGVVERILYDAAGSELGRWQYRNGLWPAGPYGGCTPAPCETWPLETRTIVVPPGGACERHLFSAYVGSPALAGPLWSFGLPYSEATPDGSGRFLSSEVWTDHDEKGGGLFEPEFNCIGSQLRSTWVTFERDDLVAGTQPGSRNFGERETNRRLLRQRTLYHDDGTRFADVNYSSFDGLGHYRRATTSGSFAGSNVRETFTHYSPWVNDYTVDLDDDSVSGLPVPWDPDEPWILETYEDQSVIEDGQTQKVEFCWASDHSSPPRYPKDGFLLRRRLLESADGSQDSHDVIVRNIATDDGAGNVKNEQEFGGDLGSVGLGSLCAIPLSSFVYRIDHTYQSGVRASSQYMKGATTSMGFKFYDVDLDASTGLVSRSRDTSGLFGTSYTYDALGRPTLADVDSGEGADTVYTYDAASWNGTTFTPATVSVEQQDIGGARLALSGFEFDPFGRLAREERRMPDGSDAQRTIEYDAQGRRERVSEWGTDVAPGGDTVFEYDEFGRPTLVTAADGQSTDFTYTGVSKVDRTATIGGAGPVTVREVYDRFGRLHAVEEPMGGGNSFTYGYDEGNRLAEVTSPSATPIQTRTFDYDGRGFLVSETHPELGGAVVYSNYDTRGHAGRREQRDAQGAAFQRLDFTYDKAERLLTATDALASRPLKGFTYDDGSVPNPSRLDGRLREAVRHNWVNVPWDGTASDVDVTVTETYAYDQVGARASRRTTTTNRESLQFVTDFTYDELGNALTTVYPDCTGATCPTGEPSRTVKNAYDNGFLTKIGTPTNAGIYASSITYHPNAMWGLIQRTGNAADDTQAIATNGMRRPLRLSNQVVSGTAFDTGTYAYDEVGNVTAMGTDSFTYDDRNRLDEANVEGYAQAFTYDFYGNLTEYVTTPPGGGPATTTISTDAATNRLAGTNPTARYDPAGNLTLLAGTTYLYDALNMETRRSPPGLPGTEPQWTNLYSADDERLWILVHGSNPTPGETGSAGSQALFLRDLSGKLLRQYRKSHTTVPPDPNQLWAWSRDHVWRQGALHAIEKQGFGRQHVHTDNLGSIRQLTSTAGAVLSDHDYLPFGEGIPTSASAVALQHTGHERELHGNGEIDNLDYLHARFRSPVYARFLSVDPVVGGPDVPQGWNRYAYVVDNPLNYTDPSGLFVFSPWASAYGRAHSMCLEFGLCIGETVVVTASAPTLNPLTGLQGLRDLISGRTQMDSFGDEGRTSFRLNPLQRALSNVPVNGTDYGDCVRQNRLDYWQVIAGSALPKRLLPPFRVPYPDQPLTTPASVAAHGVTSAWPRSPAAQNLARSLRGAGRVVSRVATPLTMAEGIYDIGVLGYCAGAD